MISIIRKPEDKTQAKRTALETYRKTGSVDLAAKAAGVSDRAIRQWRRQSVAYARAWQAAKQHWVDTLEGKAAEIATIGKIVLDKDKQPVFVWYDSAGRLVDRTTAERTAAEIESLESERASLKRELRDPNLNGRKAEIHDRLAEIGPELAELRTVCHSYEPLREISESMLVKMLESHIPERYTKRQSIESILKIEEMSDEQLAAEEKRLGLAPEVFKLPHYEPN